jgi:hypothetical protein
MSEKKNLLERILVIMPIAVLIAASYVGWTFYSRWSTGRELKKADEARQAERARKEVEMSGGTTLRIMSLYAIPPSIARGQTAQLCYGVANAKSVKFEPAVESVWPSRNRCVDVAPKKTTTYKLLVDDGAGHSDHAEIEIRVK